MLGPGLLFLISAVVLAVTVWRFKWHLPLALIFVSVLAALLAGYWIPFRHLVEGGFGYINLALGLFAGAFFGQMMRLSGAADAVAVKVDRAVNGNVWLVLFFAGAVLYLVGIFVGIAGIAVLATGVFVLPLLRRIGMNPHEIGAFIAVMATCGMIGPPLNVPAMSIADGVNMPYAGFGIPLLMLSLPPALVLLAMSGLRLRGRARNEVHVASVGGAGGALPPGVGEDGVRANAALAGFLALGLVLGFWTVLRLFPTTVPDPAAPLVLVIGGLIAMPLLNRDRLSGAMTATFSGMPLILATVLVTVGIAVQIMTLTGMRGWLVINAMSFPPGVSLALVPIFGGVLTSIGAANIIGVPIAFASIGQDMILNAAALSAISALSEFVPPTSIAAALATYIVGDTTLGKVIKGSIIPLIVIAVLGVLMLVFATELSSLIHATAPSFMI